MAGLSLHRGGCTGSRIPDLEDDRLDVRAIAGAGIANLVGVGTATLDADVVGPGAGSILV